MSPREWPARDVASPLADPGLRLAARTIDVALPLAPMLLVCPAGILLAMPTLLRAGLGLTFLSGLALLLLDVWWLHRHGQSVGKRLLGLRIVREDGTRAELLRLVTLRGLVPLVLELVPLLGPIFSLADALLIFTAERRTLHDRMAGTIVIDVRRTPPPEEPGVNESEAVTEREMS